MGQAVRSAGYPPAKMFGETTDEMASLNETARRGAQQMREPMDSIQDGFQDRDFQPFDVGYEEGLRLPYIPMGDAASMVEEAAMEMEPPRRMRMDSGEQSVTLAQLRGNPAYDVGFRRFLQEREQYKSSQRPSISEEEEFFKGGSMYAESARDRAIRDRDNASIEALGFAEGQEFAERETQRSVDRALRGGLRMEPTREDVAFMESVSRPEDIEFKQRPEDIVVEQDIPPEML